jgi:hypothetical protein
MIVMFYSSWTVDTWKLRNSNLHPAQISIPGSINEMTDCNLVHLAWHLASVSSVDLHGHENVSKFQGKQSLWTKDKKTLVRAVHIVGSLLPFPPLCIRKWAPQVKKSCIRFEASVNQITSSHFAAQKM